MSLENDLGYTKEAGPIDPVKSYIKGVGAASVKATQKKYLGND